jgi:hypothetical protein
VQARLGADGALAPRTALTFQGWSSQAFRFAITQSDRRIVMELDRENPLLARHLVLKDIVDMRGTSTAFGDSPDAPLAYQHVLRDLGMLLDEMPFLSLVIPK